MLQEVSICKNCKSEFQDNYCGSCGQKRVSDSDFFLRNIFGQALDAFTNLDSKFIKTFVLLFSKPGRLSKNYVEGIRMPYLKPFQIFIICNLLFFIFLGDTDLFRTPSQWFFNPYIDVYGKNIMVKAEDIMKDKNMSFEAIKYEYDRLSSDLSKGLLIILIPFISILGILINRKLKFGIHLIFATHLFSFILIFATGLYLIASILNLTSMYFFGIPIFAGIPIYYSLAIKNFYGRSAVYSILLGIVGFAMLLGLVLVYRSSVSLFSLYLMG